MDTIIQNYIYQQQKIWTQKETIINIGQNKLKSIVIIDIWKYWKDDNTHTVQRLQAYHHPILSILLNTHMPCSIQLLVTPLIAPTYWLIMMCRFQSLAYQMKPPKIPKILKTHQKYNPLNQIISKPNQTHC